MAPRTAIKAKVSVAPALKESSRGGHYCNFGVMDDKDRPVACTAFGHVAVQLSDVCEVGFSINLWGNEKEGAFMVSGFDIPKVGGAVRAKNYRTAPPPRMEVDDLMDVLGPGYVTERVRQWARASMVMTREAKRGMSKALSSFDIKGWRGLLDELKLEADIERAVNDGSNKEEV